MGNVAKTLRTVCGLWLLSCGPVNVINKFAEIFTGFGGKPLGWGVKTDLQGTDFNSGGDEDLGNLCDFLSSVSYLGSGAELQ